MIRLKPVTKVTLGLVLLTTSMLLVADLLGLIPNQMAGELAARKKFCESLAVELSVAATQKASSLVQATLDAVVERNEEVLSAAVRIIGSGATLAVAGDHAAHWKDIPLDQSTATHVQVPIFLREQRWGTVEIAFQPLPETSALGLGRATLLLLAFVTVVGLVAYRVFIGRVVRELNPTNVIPERVRSAFDALAEGLLILDEKEQIVLANRAFGERIGRNSEQLVGRRASELTWDLPKAGRQRRPLPWTESVTEKARRIGVALKFLDSDDRHRTFMVNSTPILDSDGVVRGALATFDDMTDLEKRQRELNRTVAKLRESEKVLKDKAVELEFLATRDPLTGCLNRRAFFEGLDIAFAEARRGQRSLGCIMADIDHFKSVNDRYGHATGDKVIKMVGETLRSQARPNDLVGRYGGEEFCMVLVDSDLEDTAAVAERLRLGIREEAESRFTAAVRVTASFGVSVLAGDLREPSELVNLADKALYMAKESGRNRVIRWGDASGQEVPAESPQTLPGEATVDEAQEQDLSARLESMTDKVIRLEGEIRKRDEALKRKVGHDESTGLPNRVLFQDRLHQALLRVRRYHRFAAVIALEIDAFQRIHNALGHVVGEGLLKHAAQVLREVVRASDTVAIMGPEESETTVFRIGEDEFGLLVTDLEDAESVTWIAKRVLERLARRVVIDGHEIFVTCSAGIAVAPNDGDEASTLLEHATAAKITAKQQPGRNNFRFYSSEINKAAYRQLWMEAQLHHALERGELRLYYQPKVDLNDGGLTGFEALIRWEHPKLGLVPPDEFIPVAEQTGLIDAIGDWVTREACAQLRRWQLSERADITVAVNLSAVQFRQEDLAARIKSIVADVGLEASSLELEITESLFLEHFDRAVRVIRELNEEGIRFTIDDFGTGYSSLSYLRNLPVDALKIDRSFLSDAVPNPQDESIITAIIAMAHSMGMRVVAEGVETEVQRQFLNRLHCDEIQGYLLSRPVPADEATQLLAGGARKLARLRA